MFCPQCGSPCDGEARFCGKCGAAIGDAAGSSLTQRGAPRPTSPALAPRGDVVTGKDPTIALVLSVLFGCLGAGQFYNGDFKKAIAMVCGSLFLGPPTLGFASLGIWVWSAIDAYQVASGQRRPW